jgi:hypothetical protein
MKIRKSIHIYKCQDPVSPHAQFQVIWGNVSVVQFLVDATRNVNELEYVPRISSGGGNKQTLSLKAALWSREDVAAVILQPGHQKNMNHLCQ